MIPHTTVLDTSQVFTNISDVLLDIIYKEHFHHFLLKVKSYKKE